MKDGWDNWHENMATEDIPMPSTQFIKASNVMCDALLPILRKTFPIIRAHAGATHMLEGFNPKRNKWDDLVDEIQNRTKHIRT